VPTGDNSVDARLRDTDCSDFFSLDGFQTSLIDRRMFLRQVWRSLSGVRSLDHDADARVLTLARQPATPQRKAPRMNQTLISRGFKSRPRSHDYRGYGGPARAARRPPMPRMRCLCTARPCGNKALQNTGVAGATTGWLSPTLGRERLSIEVNAGNGNVTTDLSDEGRGCR
jgi:hypothetical protein